MTNVITPSATVCTTSSSGSGGGGGSGGGSQIYGSSPTAPGYVNTNPTATSSTVSSLVPTSSAAVSTATTSLSTSSVAAVTAPAFVFTRDLDLGFTGADVKQLQKFLNANGFSIVPSGPGSPGNETSYFGPATQAALAKFQAANGISPAAGYFGPKTRAYISRSSAAPIPTQAAKIASSTSSTFARDLQLGDTGEDVRALQQYLNAHGFQLANYGPGSPGNETELFGSATQYQLAQFQKANGLPATGFFGPLTRAAIAGLSTTTAQ